MSKLWLRIAELRIGKPGQPGLDINGLRVKFSISKSSASTVNTASISVFNLSPAHRGMCEDTGLSITLMAGYKGVPGQPGPFGVICQGNINWTSSEKQGQDIVTTFEVQDGGTALREGSVNVSFGPGTTRKAVIDYLARKLAGDYGLTYNGMLLPLGMDPGQFVNGVVLSGDIKGLLDTYTKPLNIIWHIQDGEILIGPRTIDIPGAVVVSKDTGMIGIPVKHIGQGVEVTSLLNPLIRPGKTIQIISSISDKTNNLNGFYHVERAEYCGDTLEGDWTVKAETLEQSQLSNYQAI